MTQAVKNPAMTVEQLEHLLAAEFPQAFHPASGLSIEAVWHGGGRVRQAVLEGATESAEGLPPGVHQREGYTLVVNTSPREAETERCPAEEFLNRFSLKQAADGEAPQAAAVLPALGTELADSEFWPSLASVLLIVLVLEALIANRTAA